MWFGLNFFTIIEYKWLESTWNSMKQNFGKQLKVPIKSKPLEYDKNYSERLKVHVVVGFIP